VGDVRCPNRVRIYWERDCSFEMLVDFRWVLNVDGGV